MKYMYGYDPGAYKNPDWLFYIHNFSYRDAVIRDIERCGRYDRKKEEIFFSFGRIRCIVDIRAHKTKEDLCGSIVRLLDGEPLITGNERTHYCGPSIPDDNMAADIAYRNIRELPYAGTQLSAMVLAGPWCCDMWLRKSVLHEAADRFLEWSGAYEAYEGNDTAAGTCIAGMAEDYGDEDVAEDE